jgi:Tfp pilus assembly protein PilV
MDLRVSKRVGGFTMLEALVATMVLTATLATLHGIVSRCLYRVQLNEEYERAWQILDRQMTVIDAMGIDTYVLEPQQEGEIEEEGMFFQWKVDTVVESIDCLYEVTITIWWGPEAKPHVISATTKLDGVIPSTLTTGGM